MCTNILLYSFLYVQLYNISTIYIQLALQLFVQMQSTAYAVCIKWFTMTPKYYLFCTALLCITLFYLVEKVISDMHTNGRTDKVICRCYTAHKITYRYMYSRLLCTYEGCTVHFSTMQRDAVINIQIECTLHCKNICQM